MQIDTRTFSFVSAACAVIFAAGCSGSKETPEPVGEFVLEVVQFSSASSNAPVVIDSASTTDTTTSIIADFNLDGINDLARMEDQPDGKKQVAIYLREKRFSSEEIKQSVYRLAGTIQGQLGGEVAGIAGRRREGFMDLIILFRSPDGSTRMVHFRNDGSGLTPVMD